MITSGLIVSVCCQNQSRYGSQPATEESHQVKRGFVGPVNVLEDQHGRALRSGQIGIYRVEQARTVLVTQDRGNRVAESAGHVDEGSSRPRRRHGIAPSDEDLGPRRNRIGERLDQQRLARARLAADEDEMAETEARLLEQVLEARELVVTLQHSSHVRIIPRPRATELLWLRPLTAHGKWPRRLVDDRPYDRQTGEPDRRTRVVRRGLQPSRCGADERL